MENLASFFNSSWTYSQKAYVGGAEKATIVNWTWTNFNSNPSIFFYKMIYYLWYRTPIFFTAENVKAIASGQSIKEPYVRKPKKVCLLCNFVHFSTGSYLVHDFTYFSVRIFGKKLGEGNESGSVIFQNT